MSEGSSPPAKRGRRDAGGGKRAAPGTYERIYAVVRQIPAGFVATYGDVAILAGLPRRARLVGYALHALPEGSDVPWHRVVNARGRISIGRVDPAGELHQRRLLEEEGVEFDPGGCISLERFGWPGP